MAEKTVDKDKVQEVINWAENNSDAYDALMRNYLPNLSKKVLKGIYDKVLAVKLLVYYYENYVRVPFSAPREMGYDPRLNPAERVLFAEHFVDYLEKEFLDEVKKKAEKIKQDANAKLKAKKEAQPVRIKYKQNKTEDGVDVYAVFVDQVNPSSGMVNVYSLQDGSTSADQGYIKKGRRPEPAMLEKLKQAMQANISTEILSRLKEVK